MRVLLLNPPGERVYIRDYFCSKTTKSNYLFHPIDLVMLSGTVGSRHEIAVLDAIAEDLSIGESRERIERERRSGVLRAAEEESEGERARVHRARA